LAHDIKNPLSSVYSFAEMLTNRLKDSKDGLSLEKHLYYLSLIHSGAANAMNFVDNVCSFV
jgi:signal transduction histidine kinase